MTITPSDMTPAQFKGMLNDLHLSQVQLARQIKATPRAVNYWAAGRRKIPGSVEAYLRVLDQSPKSLRDLERDDTIPSEAQREIRLNEWDVLNSLTRTSEYIGELIAERNALQKVIDRLTSEGALKKASVAYISDERDGEKTMHSAITAAIEAASAHNEGGEGL